MNSEHRVPHTFNKYVHSTYIVQCTRWWNIIGTQNSISLPPFASFVCFTSIALPNIAIFFSIEKIIKDLAEPKKKAKREGAIVIYIIMGASVI